ncbi:MAG: hypothetical protein Q9203_005677 [Teloschistes exilis]
MSMDYLSFNVEHLEYVRGYPIQSVPLLTYQGHSYPRYPRFSPNVIRLSFPSILMYNIAFSTMSAKGLLPLLRPFISCPNRLSQSSSRSIHICTPRVRTAPRIAVWSSRDNLRQWRRYASISSADEAIEEITEM